MKKLSLLFGLLMILVPAFLFSQSSKETEIIILHINDIHGRIDKMPYLSTMVKDIEKTHKNVLLFSAGDNFSGNPIVDKYSEKGFPMIDLMNMLPVTLSTLGNHEFDFGGEVLNKRISEMKQTVIAANITKLPSYFKHLKPFEILKVDDVQIAVLGITQVSENGYPDTDLGKVKDFGFVDGIKTAKQYMPMLNKYPVRIVLSHMGVEKDSALAVQFPQINAIVGGHSHKAIQPMKIINGVAIVQAGCYLKYLGMMTIKVIGNKIISIKDTLLPILTSILPDSSVLKKVASYNHNDEFSKIAGYVGDTIKGENALGAFMTDAYCHLAKTDFAVQNSGGIRIDKLPKGSITVKQVYELDPFANELFICKMNPENIRELISCGYYKEGHPDIFSCGFKSRLHLDNAGKIIKIELVGNDNKPLDENKVYTVAMGSYLCNAYKFGKTGDFVSTKMTTTDALFKFLSQIKSANYDKASSTEIVRK
jgi:2',3'-cyclic-nucleotide 2'-phosphodiesterase (5'-nucleotidase family)